VDAKQFLGEALNLAESGHLIRRLAKESQTRNAGKSARSAPVSPAACTPGKFASLYALPGEARQSQWEHPLGTRDTDTRVEFLVDDTTASVQPIFLISQDSVTRSWCCDEPKQWGDEDAVKQEEENPRVKAQNYASSFKVTVGPKTSTQFKATLIRKFGHLVRAWRNALDADGNGILTYLEFGPTVRQAGYEGSIRELWVDTGGLSGGAVSLYELDPVSAAKLERFKEEILVRFQTCEACWRALARGGQMTLRKGAFSDGCCRIGWDADDLNLLETIHRLLDKDCTGHVNIEDILWLGQFETGAPVQNTEYKRETQRQQSRKYKGLSLVEREDMVNKQRFGARGAKPLGGGGSRLSHMAVSQFLDARKGADGTPEDGNFDE